MKSVAILGSGISSMYAILACNSLGIIPSVFSGEISFPKGAVYLRFLPEDLARKIEKKDITIFPLGWREGYITKQWVSYSKEYKSSFPQESFVDSGYDPFKALAEVFEDTSRFSRISLERTFSDEDILKLSSNFEFTFYSFPLKRTFKTRSEYMHTFHVLQSKSNPDSAGSYICYDGRPFHMTVRMSELFGQYYREISPRCPYSEDQLKKLFPECIVHTLMDLHPDTPPMDLDLELQQKKIFPIGRLATMDRSSLANEVYPYVVNQLS